jgi:hypothetical protein
MFGTRLPDLVALRMLVAVGETGSLTSASVALAVSQQAVSARMRALESQLGTGLVARSRRGSSPAGRGRFWRQPTGWRPRSTRSAPAPPPTCTWRRA